MNCEKCKYYDAEMKYCKFLEEFIIETGIEGSCESFERKEE